MDTINTQNKFKFRVWSKKLKELKYFTFDDISHAQYMTGPDIRYVWSSDHVTIIPLIEENIVTQWAGLEDANNVDVYVGDIIKYERDNSLVEVRWSKEEHDCHPCIIVRNLFTQFGKFEVVGNIFDNPSLLTV